MTIADLQKKYTGQLSLIYDEREARAITRLVMEWLFKLNQLELSLEKYRIITHEQLQTAEALLMRLLNHEPVQYVLGETYFGHLRLKVTPTVLIPRPETEELVQWIIDDYANCSASIKLVDLCTGSGCIAIALATNLPGAQVTATDVSKEAIELAIENAAMNGVQASFLCSDVLQDDFPVPHANVIVSNPPYITHAEAATMRPNVLNYEPHIALFSPGHALLFYERIARQAMDKLVPGGRVYFELNASTALEAEQLLKKLGFTDVQLRNDLSGLPRMLRGTKP